MGAWGSFFVSLYSSMFSGNDFLRSLQLRKPIAQQPVLLTIERPRGAVSIFSSPELGVGGSVWEAAEVLANFVEENFPVEGRTVLDLGSGTGVLGLCLAIGGAKSVVLTDRFDVVELLQKSLAQNALLAERVSVQELNWGEACPGLLDQKFDLVVGSELLYNGNLYDKLMSSIVNFCSPSTTVLLSYEARSSEAAWLTKANATFSSVQVHRVPNKNSERDVVILVCTQLKQ